MFNGFDDFIAGAIQENNITVLPTDHEADEMASPMFLLETHGIRESGRASLLLTHDGALKIVCINHNKGIWKGRISVGLLVGIWPKDRMGREQEFLLDCLTYHSCSKNINLNVATKSSAQF